jgi:hypothetical protein
MDMEIITLYGCVVDGFTEYEVLRIPHSNIIHVGELPDGDFEVVYTDYSGTRTAICCEPIEGWE